MDLQNFYPKFEPNQVLTAEHLNEMFNYLDQQDRLSRLRLAGAGVVCGLEIKKTVTSIIITPGFGVTSEGYLLYEPVQVNATHIRSKAYENPTHYDLFGNDSLELLTAADPGVKTPLAAVDLADKIVVLFLESVEEKIDPCTGDDCDEKGSLNRLTVRRLLVDREKLAPVHRCLYNLPDYIPPRARALVASEDIDLAVIQALYTAVLTNVEMDGLSDKLEKLYDCFSTYLEHNRFTDIDLKSIVNSVSIPAGAEVQYAYDFIKDLALAYNEFKQTALALSSACMLSDASFRRHLMLGEAVPQDSCETSAYRHYFIHVPIFNQQAQLTAKARMFYERLYFLTQHFHIPTSAEASIEITPSALKSAPLGQQAIPYYYLTGEANELVENWNFDAWQQCQFDDIFKYMPGSNYLSRSLDAYPFFRIEGHLGKKYTEAYDALMQKITTHNLPVKLRGLKVGADASAIKTTISCQMHDLEMLYYTRRSELICMLDREIDFYGSIEIDVEGPHYVPGKTGFQVTFKNKDGDTLRAFVNLTLYYKNQILFKIFENEQADIHGVFSSSEWDLYPTDITTSYTITVALDGYKDYSTIPEIKKDQIYVFEVILEKEDIYNPGDLTGVTGVVMAEGEPLPGVNVVLRGTNFGSATDLNGVYRITGVAPGVYTLATGYAGFQPFETKILIKKDTMLEANIILKPFFGRGSFGIGYSGTDLNIDVGNPIVTAGVGKPELGGLTLLHQNWGTNTLGSIYQDYLTNPFYKDLSSYWRDLFSKYFLPGGITFGTTETITYPLEMIDRLGTVSNILTEQFADFNVEAFESRFADLLDVAAKYRDKIKKDLEDPDYEEKGNEQEILRRLEMLLASCEKEKFKDLIEYYKKRTTDIKELHLLSRFIEQHSGLEHLGGVEKGGTFVLVYDENDIVIADFSLPYICCSDCPPITICKETPVIFTLPKTSFCSDDSTEYKFILNPPGGVVDGPGVSKDETTGDFYFQPSHADVEPGDVQFTYAVNDNTYALVVHVVHVQADFDVHITSINVDEDVAVVNFTGYPEDADTFEWDFGDGNTNTDEDNRDIEHTYSPFSDQPFTVTLKVTREGCGGEISKQVNIEACSAEFTYAEVSRDGDKIIFQFTAPQGLSDDYEFTWDFGDGDVVHDRNPQHEFTMEAQARTVDVTLTVSSDVCTDSHKESITIPAMELSISLPQSQFCTYDENLYPITVSPQGGVVSGEGVVDHGDGTFSFQPSAATAGDVTLSYTIGVRSIITTVNVLDVAHEITSSITMRGEGWPLHEIHLTATPVNTDQDVTWKDEDYTWSPPAPAGTGAHVTYPYDFYDHWSFDANLTVKKDICSQEFHKRVCYVEIGIDFQEDAGDAVIYGFSVKTPGAEKYVWDFGMSGDDEIVGENQIKYRKGNRVRTVTVTLTGKNEQCEATNSIRIDIPVHEMNTAKVQFIHNAADPLARFVDIHINNVHLAGFEYKSATPFREFSAGLLHVVVDVPEAGTTVEDNFQIEANKFYILILNGVTKEGGFENPHDWPTIELKIYDIADAKEHSMLDNFEALFFHGVTNAGSLTVVDSNTGALLFQDMAYSKNTKDYLKFEANYLNLLVDLRDDNVVTKCHADLDPIKGQASIILTTGFLKPPRGMEELEFGLYLVSADGNIIEFSCG